MLTTPAFTPITSLDDIRLATLIGVAVSLIEELALVTDQDPDFVLCDHLYSVTKDIHESGADCYLTKLVNYYPTLHKAVS